MNKTEAYVSNQQAFVEYMNAMYREGALVDTFIDNKEVYILNTSRCSVYMDAKDGNYINTQAGQNKSNRRQYVSIHTFDGDIMVPSYWFKVVCDGFFSASLEQKYLEFAHGRDDYGFIEVNYSVYGKETIYGPVHLYPLYINHINGNTLDNNSNNLEVVTAGQNNAHARFMSEVEYHFPELILTAIDCQGNKMHMWADGKGVSCTQIDAWNKQFERGGVHLAPLTSKVNGKQPIKAYKDKKGEFKSHFTREQMVEMLDFFGKEVR